MHVVVLSHDFTMMGYPTRKILHLARLRRIISCIRFKPLCLFAKEFAQPMLDIGVGLHRRGKQGFCEHSICA